MAFVNCKAKDFIISSELNFTVVHKEPESTQALERITQMPGRAVPKSVKTQRRSPNNKGNFLLCVDHNDVHHFLIATWAVAQTEKHEYKLK